MISILVCVIPLHQTVCFILEASTIQIGRETPRGLLSICAPRKRKTINSNLPFGGDLKHRMLLVPVFPVYDDDDEINLNSRRFS